MWKHQKKIMFQYLDANKTAHFKFLGVSLFSKYSIFFAFYLGLHESYITGFIYEVVEDILQLIVNTKGIFSC